MPNLTTAIFTEPVSVFMRACDQPFPCFTQKVILNRLNMLHSEVMETLEAFDTDDLVEVADGVADVVYVAAGGLLEFGEVMNLNDRVQMQHDFHEIVLSREAHDLLSDFANRFSALLDDDTNRIVDYPDTMDPYIWTQESMEVALRIADLCNLNVVDLFNEVQRSNMTKVLPDGSVLKDDFGKVLKPEGYERPNLLPFLGFED